MPNRIIKESICTSDEIAGLSPEAEVLFYRLMVKADDFGLYFANPKIISGTCFPLKQPKAAVVAGWLRELVAAGLVTVYEANSKEYLALLSWDKHQNVRTKRSKFPTPPKNVSVPREHDLPVERDIEDMLYDYLLTENQFNGEDLVSIDRQVRVKESYLDVVVKTNENTYVFELKRNRLSNKSTEQLENYLSIAGGHGLLIGCGVSANFDLEKCRKSNISVLVYDDEDFVITVIHQPKWFTRCEITLNHVKQRETKLAPNPIQSESNPNPIQSNPNVCAEQAPAPPPVISLPLNDKTEYPITQTQVDEWAQLYPAVDVMQELRNMRGWLDANKSKRKTKGGILRFVVGWFAREQNRGGARASPYRKKLDGLKYDQRPVDGIEIDDMGG